MKKVGFKGKRVYVMTEKEHDLLCDKLLDISVSADMIQHDLAFLNGPFTESIQEEPWAVQLITERYMDGAKEDAEKIARLSHGAYQFMSL